MSLNNPTKNHEATTSFRTASYWKFLSDKLPDTADVISDNPSSPHEANSSERDEELDVVKSLLQTLHIVSDNPKSHARAQKRSLAPPGNFSSIRSTSVPIMSMAHKSVARWGTYHNPRLNNLNFSIDRPQQGSPQIPSRSKKALDFAESRTGQSNAQWGSTSLSSAAVTSKGGPSGTNSFASGDRTRLRSMGLADLRRTNRSFDSSSSKKSRSSRSLSRSSSSSSQRSKSNGAGKKPKLASSLSFSCLDSRWAIPATASDSLLIYPTRCVD